MAHSPFGVGSLLLIALLTPPAVAQARPSSEHSYPIPKTLSLPIQALPIWAEASVAVSADGEPNPAVWGSETARILEILTTPADNPIYYNDKIVAYQQGQPSAPGCRDVGTTYFFFPDPPRRGTLDEAITNSEVAVLGRVTSKAYGFSAGEPGQLLQIEPVRSYGHPLSQPRYYFFVPVGRFTVGGVTICKTDDRYAKPPDIGDKVFLFVGKPEDTPGVFFRIYDAGDVIPVDPDGELRLPGKYATGEQGATLRASALRSESDLLARIQTLRGKGAPRRGAASVRSRLCSCLRPCTRPVAPEPIDSRSAMLRLRPDHRTRAGPLLRPRRHPRSELSRHNGPARRVAALCVAF